MRFTRMLVVMSVLGFLLPRLAPAGEVATPPAYKVLAPIRHDNLTIFPVVSTVVHDTQQFLTLDEGIRSGEVVVSESGSIQPLVRPRRGNPTGQMHHDEAQVNQLVLVNNSKRPLLLLAGEIVTGGKQDRVIGKDRIVPPQSDPIDLGVFCVEPGRWTATKANFSSLGSAMAQPAVRAKAMGEKNQEMVWSEVRSAQAAVAAKVPARAGDVITVTSSYARVMQNDEVKKQVDAVAAPIERDYQSVIRQLKDRNAVGVVVAVNGEIIWADIFASPSLLEKYWPKLVRSYAAEAFVSERKNHEVSERAAQQFLDDREGRHETVETEPGLYRHTEILGEGFRAFELASLMTKTGFDLHIAKMAE